MKEKVYIFTGGGSGGHVLPALTLIEQLKQNEGDAQASFFYVGSHTGIERELTAKAAIPYVAIATGKLRRYLSMENVKDFFKVFLGVIQAYLFLFKFKRRHCVVVATGGFVTVPVVVAAWLQGKKIVIHEQTSRVGLANKIASFFARKVFVTFPSSRQFFAQEKVTVTGYPLRKEIFSLGTKRFDHIDKPILLITGGGNGSALINQAVEEIRVELLKDFYIIHQVGKKHYGDFKGYETDQYKVFAFIGEEMVDLLKEAQVIISRSGAGTVAELMALSKPSIFIPLKIAQKNEQYYNALEAHKALGSIIIEEKDLTRDSLLEATKAVARMKRDSAASAMTNPTPVIASLIQQELS